MNFIKAVFRAITTPKMSEHDRYLSQSVDHKDLENRMKSLERANAQKLSRYY